jgi:hypothetical protein
VVAGPIVLERTGGRLGSTASRMHSFSMANSFLELDVSGARRVCAEDSSAPSEARGSVVC